MRAPGLCAALSLVALAGAACREAAPFDHVRLEGAAPAVSRTSPTRAQLYVFWASWCAPCIEELPSVLSLASAPPRELEVILVVQDPERAPLDRHAGGEVRTPVIVDATHALADSFLVSNMPAAILVDRGRLVARVDGRRDWSGTAARRTLVRLLEPGSR